MSDRKQTMEHDIDEVFQGDASIQGSLKAGAWYTICNLILKGATMLIAPFLARILTLAEYGFYSTITTWFNMIRTVVTADLAACVPRGKYEFPRRFHAFISSITVLGSLITFGFYVIVLLNRTFFCSLLGCDISFFHVQFLSFLIAPAMEMLQNRARVENKYKLSVSLTLSSWFISTAFSFLLLLNVPFRTAVLGGLSSNRVFALVFGNALPAFLLNLVIYCAILVRGRVLVDLRFWSFALIICIPLIPHLLAGAILSQSDRIMITKLCGEEYTALYSITYTCSAVISMLFNALNQAWVPWFNEQYYHKRDAVVRKITGVYCLFFFLVTIGAVMVGPELLLIVGGREYMGAVTIMPVVMVSCFFQFSNAFFVNVEMFEKRTVYSSIGTIIAAGLNITLNFLWLPRYGYAAGAYTTLIGFAFLHYYHAFVNRKLIRERLSQLYPMMLIETLLALTLAAIWPSIVLYRHNGLRYTGIALSLLAAGIVIYRQRQEIAVLMKNVLRKKK
jgi:O-antigen/teichoic acid export membrane protein